MTSSRIFKDTVFEQFARIGKAISSPKRLELLDILCQGPRTVEVLADHAGLSLANASQHLQVLRAARLLDTEKHGVFVTYRLAPGVDSFYLRLRGLAESRLAEVEATTRTFLAERGGMETVDAAELLRRAIAGEVTVLDVRPPEEYQAGHLPNARSIPLAELRDRLAELPLGRGVVAYCRGPYCVLALEAVRTLREHGFVAHRLDQGPPDWRAAGISLATVG
jgi:rhodanese-related sulfurtransferase